MAKERGQIKAKVLEKGWRTRLCEAKGNSLRHLAIGFSAETLN